MAPADLTTVIIRGAYTANPINAELQELPQDKIAIIGSGDENIYIKDIKERLNGLLKEYTKIHISMHGSNESDTYGLVLADSGLLDIKYMFRALKDLSKDQALEVHLNACYSGRAIEALKFLPQKSILFTYTSDSTTELAVLSDSLLIKSIQKNIDQKTSERPNLIQIFQDFLDLMPLKLAQNPKISFWDGNKEAIFEPIFTLEEAITNPEELLIKISKECISFCQKLSLDTSKLEIPDFRSIEFSSSIKDFTLSVLIHKIYSLGITHTEEEILSLLKSKDFDKQFLEHDIKGFTLMHALASNNCKKTVEFILDKDVNPNCIDYRGITPLESAIFCGFDELVQTLIKFHKFDANEVCEKSTKYLLQAVYNGHTEIVKILLDHGAKLQDYHMILIAMEKGHKEIVKTLIHSLKACGQKYESSLNPRLRMLYMAAKQKEQDLVDLLIQDVECQDEGFFSFTQLHKAVLINDISEVKSLLSSITNPDQRDPLGITPLYLAIMIRNKEIAKILLGSGKIDPNTSNFEEYTPLYLTVEAKEQDMTELLIKHGAFCRPEDKFDVLSKAISPKTQNILEMLLANEKTCQEYGLTKLQKAVLMGDTDKVKDLLSSEDVNTVDKTGNSALHFACKLGNNEIAALLLDFGSDIDQLNHKGLSPVFLAAHVKNVETVKLLLDRGADHIKAIEQLKSFMSNNPKNSKIFQLLLECKENLPEAIKHFELLYPLIEKKHGERFTAILKLLEEKVKDCAIKDAQLNEGFDDPSMAPDSIEQCCDKIIGSSLEDQYDIHN